MTYTFIKPDAGPSPLLDAPNIQGNFSSFQTLFSLNHTALNNRNQGKHEAVIFEQQTADPGVTDDLSVLFSKSIAGQPQLFSQILKFLPNNNDSTDVPNDALQMTYNAVNVAGPQYQSFLIGGYLVYIGSTSNIALTITLSPAPTSLLVALASPNTVISTGSQANAPFNVSTTILTASTFTISSNLNTGGPVIPYQFQWIAIGKQ